MSYNTEELERKSLTVIKRYKLVFIEEVVSYLPCSKQTFYEHKLDEVDAIKSAIEQNKVSRKVGLRSKMYKADNPSAWIALYKLLGTDDEADRLNGSRQKLEASIKHSVDGETVELINKIYNGTGTIK